MRCLASSQSVPSTASLFGERSTARRRALLCVRPRSIAAPPGERSAPPSEAEAAAEAALRSSAGDVAGIPRAEFLRVQSPARYLGNEFGAVRKPWGADNETVRFALTYPEIYEVGASNLGHIILYSVLNQQEGLLCDRAYMPGQSTGQSVAAAAAEAAAAAAAAATARVRPRTAAWQRHRQYPGGRLAAAVPCCRARVPSRRRPAGEDLKALLERHGRKLFGVESRRPLCDFHALGFSLAYELGASNILEMLRLSGIPLSWEVRGAAGSPPGGCGAGGPGPTREQAARATHRRRALCARTLALVVQSGGPHSARPRCLLLPCVCRSAASLPACRGTRQLARRRSSSPAARLRPVIQNLLAACLISLPWGTERSFW